MRTSYDPLADTFDLLTPGYDGELVEADIGCRPAVPNISRHDNGLCGPTCRINLGDPNNRCISSLAPCPFRKEPRER